MKKKKARIDTRLKDARERILYLEGELRRVSNDRQVLRDWYTAKFKWFVELLAASESPNLKWLVTDMVKTMQKAEKWWW